MPALRRWLHFLFGVAIALSGALDASSLVESREPDPFSQAAGFIRSLVENKPFEHLERPQPKRRPRGWRRWIHHDVDPKDLLPADAPELIPSPPNPPPPRPPSAPPPPRRLPDDRTSSAALTAFRNAAVNLTVAPLDVDEEKEYELLHIELRAAAEKIANPRGYPATKEELEKSSPATKAIMDRLAELAGLRDRDTTVRGPCPGHCQGRGECDYETSECKCEKCYGGVDCGECGTPCPSCGAGGRCDCCTGTCICSPGYYGDDCTCIRSRWNQKTQLDELTASGHGCRAQFGEGAATCDEGWETVASPDGVGETQHSGWFDCGPRSSLDASRTHCATRHTQG